MSHPIHVRAKHLAHNVIRNVTSARKNKSVIMKFADKAGLLYFGAVSQQSDEHQVVRGFTASSSHQDNHFCVGSVGEYDVILIERNDAIWQSEGTIAINNWLIITFKLHTSRDIPHFFIHANRRASKAYDTLFSTYPAMKEIRMGTLESYNQEFTSRFTVYTQPSNSVEIEKLIPASTAKVLGAHFWPLSTESHYGVLYIYADGKRITPHLLNAMLECGLWLAGHLDAQSELIN